MSSLPPPVAPPPPGWYPDPAGGPDLYWWDGIRWSGDVAESPPPPEVKFPVAAGAVAVLATLVVGVITRPVSRALVDGVPILFVLAFSVAAVYGPMVAACVAVARKYGPRRLRDAFGLRLRPVDVGWGAITLLAAWAVEISVVLACQALDIPVGSNTEGIGDTTDDRLLYLTLAAVAVILAPLVEELFFRGLVQRSLRSRLAPVWAVIGQGLVFGGFHADPGYGAGNIGLVLALSAVGAVFGAAAQLVRRLGPGMVAHGCFNAVVFVVLLVAES
ncbi:MAG TPA: CPBP family intramembrane glutamic endopeptidase [Acidimicrobiales bacterium]